MCIWDAPYDRDIRATREICTHVRTVEARIRLLRSEIGSWSFPRRWLHSGEWKIWKRHSETRHCPWAHVDELRGEGPIQRCSIHFHCQDSRTDENNLMGIGREKHEKPHMYEDLEERQRRRKKYRKKEEKGGKGEEEGSGGNQREERGGGIKRSNSRRSCSFPFSAQEGLFPALICSTAGTLIPSFPVCSRDWSGQPEEKERTPRRRRSGRGKG